ncbi:MAG TPA: DUF3352 domain-containing protein, partial [Candidatus Eisenbacteria bacterium]|nr:DUF3352 domain-containing protein [Candidatus Eisenbacteria bacterium]
MPSSRRRWLIAGGVAILAIAAVIAGVMLLGSSPTPEALRYIPADSVVVGELRLDLPGDQLEKVGNLLAHFPGFKDQSNLPQKLDETFARLVQTASSGAADYQTDLKPWLAGPTFFGLRTPGSDGKPSERAVIVATTDGKVACQPLFEGHPTTHETRAGVDVEVADDGNVACALDGRYGIIGDPDSVRAALDAHAAGSGVNASADYKAAREALGADRLMTVFVAGKDFAELQGMLQGELPSSAPSLGMLQTLPRWAIAGFRAEDDALVMDLVSAPAEVASASGAPAQITPASSLPTAPPPRISTLATLLPGDTVALAEGHGVGVGIQSVLAGLRAEPTTAETVGQLDSALALLGGAEGLLGWIGDAAVVVVPDGSSVAGGLVLLAPDDTTATEKVGQLTSILTLAGLGAGIDIEETTVNGTKITTATFGDLGSLLRLAGANVDVPEGTSLEISIAARGQLVMIGGGETFARHILEASDRLADQAAYKRALGRVADKNLAQIYVATSAL